MINKINLKSIIYATTVFCSVENTFACDNNSDLSNPLSVSAQSSYSNCGNISIPGNLITTSTTAISAINVLDQFSNAVVAANPDYNVELINGNGVENQKVKITFSH